MMTRANALLLCTMAFPAGHAATVDAALETEYIMSNGLNFTCSVLKHTSEDPGAEKKNFLLLHGFPHSRHWWSPLMQHWDDLLGNTTAVSKSGRSLPPVSLHAVACDLRGYSPGASPDDIEEYTIAKFAEDAFGLAEASGFEDGFHLLGHDHGAGLSWYMAANDPKNQILSLTTMSVPHLQAFSDALCGENSDPDQIVAGNYINQLAVPDSATTNDGALYKTFKTYLGLDPDVEPAQFQKWLWWYNAMRKVVSFPPVVSDEVVDAYEGLTLFIDVIRSAIPLEERTCDPQAVDVPIGAVEIPTLFICGVNDIAILCSHPYAADLPPDLLPNYEHVNFECGHDFFEKGNCDSLEESQAVMEKVTDFVLGTSDATAKAEREQAKESTSSAPAATLRGAIATVTVALGSVFVMSY